MSWRRGPAPPPRVAPATRFRLEAREGQLVGELSRSITAVWEDVLGVPVTEDTNFYAVGGHSFLAARILAGVQRATGFRPTLRSLFDNPRLADFVAAVAAERQRAESGV